MRVSTRFDLELFSHQVSLVVFHSMRISALEEGSVSPLYILRPHTTNCLVAPYHLLGSSPASRADTHTGNQMFFSWFIYEVGSAPRTVFDQDDAWYL